MAMHHASFTKRIAPNIGFLQPMVEDRVTPGGVLLVSTVGHPSWVEVRGTTAYDDAGSSLVQADNIYDIASITKVITATGLLMLADRGEVSLDDRLSKFFPWCRYGDKVTVGNLLTHTSAIAIQMSRVANLPPESIHDAVLEAPLDGNPGERVLFTNANSYLLGRVIEGVTAQSLDQFLKTEIFAPLKMRHTAFNPPNSWHQAIAPTQLSNGLDRGVVHDSSARALGGVAGHAGLFSTAGDLHRFSEMWLKEGTYGHYRLFGAALSQIAIRNHAPTGSPGTGLGWMLDRPWMGPAAHYAFGHTAFTGPSTMIDPVNGMIVILLTNRTYHLAGDLDRHAYHARMIEQLHRTIAADRPGETRPSDGG